MAKHPKANTAHESIGNDGDLFGTAPLPTAVLDDKQRLACLRLIRSENVGPVSFRTLINRYGGAEQALDALPNLAKSGGKRNIKVCSMDRAEAELEHASKHGAEPLFTIEPHYPRALALLETPPPLIYLKGRKDLIDKPALAVVGARNASAAGCKIARTFAAELGKAGLVIVSGLARGVDGAAHSAALETGTIAVLAGGLDIIYPPEHEKLHHTISEHGCLISEMPCGFKPRGQDFPRRNRLISGLSIGVVVVEAARRSGTLVTARYAGEQNREVFAVPGHPLDPRAEGTNQLLKSGATFVTSSKDILEILQPLAAGFDETAPKFRQPITFDYETADRTKKVEQTHGVTGPAEDLSGSPPISMNTSENDSHRLQQTVLDSLGPAPIEIDELARTTGLPIREINIILVELDLANKITRHGLQLVSRAQSDGR